jgi:hypothetical protein
MVVFRFLITVIEYLGDATQGSTLTKTNDAVSQYDARFNFLPILLNTMRWLSSFPLPEANDVASRFTGMLPNLNAQAQHDVLGALAEIFPEAIHERVARDVAALLPSFPEQTPAFLDALSQLATPSDLQNDLIDHVISTLESIDDKGFPVSVRFLLDEAFLGDAEKACLVVRRLHESWSLDGLGAATIRLVADELRSAVVRTAGIANAFLELLLSGSEPWRPIDLLVFIIILDRRAISPSRKRALIRNFRDCAKHQRITAAIITDLFSTGSGALQSSHTTLFSLADSLIRPPSNPFSSSGISEKEKIPAEIALVASSILKNSFKYFDAHLQQTCITQVVALVTTGTSPQAQWAVQWLQSIALESPSLSRAFRPYSVFIRGLLDHRAALVTANVLGLVLQLLGALAYSSDRTRDLRMSDADPAATDLALVAAKFLDRSTPKEIRVGVLATLAVAAHLAPADAEDRWGSDVTEALQRAGDAINTCFQKCTKDPLALADFLDDLADIISGSDESITENVHQSISIVASDCAGQILDLLLGPPENCDIIDALKLLPNGTVEYISEKIDWTDEQRSLYLCIPEVIVAAAPSLRLYFAASGAKYTEVLAEIVSLPIIMPKSGCNGAVPVVRQIINSLVAGKSADAEIAACRRIRHLVELALRFDCIDEANRGIAGSSSKRDVEVNSELSDDNSVEETLKNVKRRVLIDPSADIPNSSSSDAFLAIGLSPWASKVEQQMRMRPLVPEAHELVCRMRGRPKEVAYLALDLAHSISKPCSKQRPINLSETAPKLVGSLCRRLVDCGACADTPEESSLVVDSIVSALISLIQASSCSKLGNENLDNQLAPIISSMAQAIEDMLRSNQSFKSKSEEDWVLDPVCHGTLALGNVKRILLESTTCVIDFLAGFLPLATLQSSLALFELMSTISSPIILSIGEKKNDQVLSIRTRLHESARCLLLKPSWSLGNNAIPSSALEKLIGAELSYSLSPLTRIREYIHHMVYLCSEDHERIDDGNVLSLEVDAPLLTRPNFLPFYKVGGIFHKSNALEEFLTVTQCRHAFGILVFWSKAKTFQVCEVRTWGAP